ncbi:unnamed protein product [Dibothriocephalus latus]|uniref:Uncharacterized protein n=1 Tax=Dibothriocephalus latus TaxID=60516 RepID=A0A3P7M2E0_DIBLA|nr:unnamed protein product [Dibothriocephalus latus]
MNHRAYVLSWFPGLQILDGVEPTQQERQVNFDLLVPIAKPYDDRCGPSYAPQRDLHHHAWEHQEVQVNGHNHQAYDPTHQPWLLEPQKPSVKADAYTGFSSLLSQEYGKFASGPDGNSVCPDRQQAFREQSKIPIHASSNSPPQYHRVFGSSSLATSAGSLM